MFTNSSGCDSLVVLDLTINTSDTTTTQETACDTYTWLGTTYTISGVYDSLFTNSSGCDSLVVLDLTINTSDTTTEILVLHTWITTNSMEFMIVCLLIAVAVIV